MLDGIDLTAGQWTVLAILWGFVVIAVLRFFHVAAGPRTLDEVFPIEDRPTTRGGEHGFVPVQPGDLSNQDEINLHTGAK